LYNFSSVIKKIYNNNNNVCIDNTYLSPSDKYILSKFIKKI
jgi:hypothetical protein